MNGVGGSPRRHLIFVGFWEDETDLNPVGGSIWRFSIHTLVSIPFLRYEIPQPYYFPSPRVCRRDQGTEY